MRAALLALVLALSALQVFGQDADKTAATPLREVEPAIVEGHKMSATFGPFQCDSDHNVLLGIPTVRDNLIIGGSGILLKVSSAGHVLAQFAIPPDASSLMFRSYFLSHDGDVYWLAWEPKQDVSTVFRYGRDGQLKSRVELDARIRPLGPMGIFPDGQVLVAGVDASGPSLTQPYTAIFDASGKLLKKVVLEDDTRLEEAARSHDKGTVPTSSGGGNAAVVYGAVTVGPDGNLYLMRHSNPAVIYAVSASGDVVRSYRVTPTDPDLVPRSLFAEAGQIAVVFIRWATQGGVRSVAEVRLLDPGSGEITATYQGSESLGSGVACYERGGKITFVGAKDGHMALRFAQP